MALMFILIFVLLGFALLLWRAFVLSVLWGWFIAPVFNLPDLSVVESAGLSIVVSLLVYTYQSSAAREDGEVVGAAALSSFLISLFSLFSGWVVHQFWM